MHIWGNFLNKGDKRKIPYKYQGFSLNSLRLFEWSLIYDNFYSFSIKFGESTSLSLNNFLCISSSNPDRFQVQDRLRQRRVNF